LGELKTKVVFILLCGDTCPQNAGFYDQKVKKKKLSALKNMLR
jgi:hypothetical protein